MWKNQLVSEIKLNLEMAKAKNSRYSMRSYAKRIGIGYGALSEILSGKRVITEVMAKKILKSLVLEEPKSAYFYEQLEKSKNKEVKLLPSQAHKVIEHWEYFAVINLIEIHGKLTKEEISNRLGIKKNKTNQILKELAVWGFLVKNDDSFETLSTQWSSEDEISSQSVRKSHLQGLLLARKALLNLPVDQRDMTSLVFPGNSKQLSKVKKEVRKFMTKIYKLMSVGSADRVYKFNVQLFPLDRE